MLVVRTWYCTAHLGIIIALVLKSKISHTSLVVSHVPFTIKQIYILSISGVKLKVYFYCFDELKNINPFMLHVPNEFLSGGHDILASLLLLPHCCQSPYLYTFFLFLFLIYNLGSNPCRLKHILGTNWLIKLHQVSN